MIEGLKPYAEYKESGQGWLGKVPAHWDLKPGHAAFSKRKVSNVGLKENTVLSLSYGRIKIKAVDKQHGLVPASYETYQIVDEGNVIVRGTDLQNDKTSLRIGLSRNRGIISSAYLCLEARETISPDYGYHILNVFDLTKAIYRYGSGLRQNLDHGEIKRLPVFIPPPEEQAAIVRFLDHANRKIDGFIRAKRKLIGLLNEQKQAIIHRAVTRGLDPTAPLKPSGLSWLGDIPAHWEVRRVKFVVDHLGPGIQMGPFGSSLTTLESSDTGFKLYGQENTISGDFTRGSRWLTQDQFLSLRKYELLPGDIVLTRKGSIGKARIVPGEIGTGIADSDTIRVRLDHRLVFPEFIVEVLHTSKYIFRQFEMSQRGAILGGLNTTTIGNILLVLPPKTEQSQLLQGLRVATEPLDTAIARTEREIALMQEYRTRLTADIVTGKLDVREAAARLPDAIPTPDANDAAPEHDHAESDDDEVAV